MEVIFALLWIVLIIIAVVITVRVPSAPYDKVFEDEETESVLRDISRGEAEDGL